MLGKRATAAHRAEIDLPDDDDLITLPRHSLLEWWAGQFAELPRRSTRTRSRLPSTSGTVRLAYDSVGHWLERQRTELGVRLLRLRHAAGLTQRQLAERPDVRQPTVSRFEAGRDIPTSEILGRIADALGLPEESRREPEDRLAELRVEVRAARLLLRQGARAVQLQIGQRETHATSVGSYHHALVPGLLQTADYTRDMAAVLDPEIEVDVDEFVSAREDRHEAVYQSEQWTTTIAPRLAELLRDEQMVVTRLMPTARSAMR